MKRPLLATQQNTEPLGRWTADQQIPVHVMKKTKHAVELGVMEGFVQTVLWAGFM